MISLTQAAARPRAAGCNRRRRVPRDDWKYDEELWDEDDREEKKLPPEKQCQRCLHWIPRESPHCNWCGKVFDEREKP
jgi:hypothetical protein